MEFAKTCGPAARKMNTAALGDHALELLQNIISDLRTPQTEAEQQDKSKGNADAEDTGAEPDTAAEGHGAGRAGSGFTVAEMAAEYRALRASVIRLWTQANGTLTGADLDDLMRFNEAIDQSLAESITRYTQDVDRSKEMFLAILGHDLRTPLGAVITSSQFMLDTGDLEEPNLTLATRIVRSSKRMNRMVGDLLDFTRGQLASGVPITRQEMDLAKETRHAVDEIEAAHPDRLLTLSISGDLHGNWDCARIGQVLANLLGNAVQHGSPDSPITVTARGEATEAVVTVSNGGTPIQAADLPYLFDPFKRLRSGDTSAHPSSSPSGSLGLGLYIAERIVSAHAGMIDVSSNEDTGTTFTVHLPR
ncbi:MAG: HAMP domain-containing histidine kinase [Gemmatimonadota bacterium]|nr:HAMP domain-containing histidine kinase [Gemmatimonadota bacterium]